MENDFEIQRYEKVPLNFIFKSMKLVGLKMKKTFKISHKRCKYGKNQCHLFCSRVTKYAVCMELQAACFLCNFATVPVTVPCVPKNIKTHIQKIPVECYKIIISII